MSYSYSILNILSTISDLFVTPFGRNSTGLEYDEIRRQDNKVLLIFEHNWVVQEFVAKDICGKTRFMVQEQLNGFINDIRMANGSTFGTLRASDIYDKNGWLLLCCDIALNNWYGYPVFSMIKPTSQIEVGAINYNSMFVTLSVDEKTSCQLKAVIISLCMKLGYHGFSNT